MLLAARLAEWQPTQRVQPGLNSAEIALASWTSLGLRYTGRPCYHWTGTGPAASVTEIVYLARSIRTRVLRKMGQTAVQT